MKRPGVLGSILLILFPIPVGILLLLSGMSAGFDGSGLWAAHLTYVGASVAVIGPSVVTIGLWAAGRFSGRATANDSKVDEGKGSSTASEKEK